MACAHHDDIRRTNRRQICASAVLRICRERRIQTEGEHCNVHTSLQDNGHHVPQPLLAFPAIALSAVLVEDNLASFLCYAAFTIPRIFKHCSHIHFLVLLRIKNSPVSAFA